MIIITLLLPNFTYLSYSYRDWTPAIRQKVSLDGFSDFPDTTPKGFSRKLELLSPLLADFNEHNHDVSSSSNNNLHFTANSEALRDRYEITFPTIFALFFTHFTLIIQSQQTQRNCCRW